MNYFNVSASWLFQTSDLLPVDFTLCRVGFFT